MGRQGDYQRTETRQAEECGAPWTSEWNGIRNGVFEVRSVSCVRSFEFFFLDYVCSVHFHLLDTRFVYLLDNVIVVIVFGDEELCFFF